MAPPGIQRVNLCIQWPYSIHSLSDHQCWSVVFCHWFRASVTCLRDLLPNLDSCLFSCSQPGEVCLPLFIYLPILFNIMIPQSHCWNRASWFGTLEWYTSWCHVIVLFVLSYLNSSLSVAFKAALFIDYFQWLLLPNKCSKPYADIGCLFLPCYMTHGSVFHPHT